MNDADHDLLARLTINASVDPTHITRADLQRLMALAGFDKRSPVWVEAMASGEDPLWVGRKAVLVMIDRARGMDRG